MQLQQQLGEHQQALQAKEASIDTLQEKQKDLTEKLAQVQEEYAQSKQSLSKQANSQSDLNNQMSSLEQALAQSKQQLADKEQALQAAQQELESTQSKLSEQENALLSAHKQELEQANQQAEKATNKWPEIEKLPLPEKPAVWFDLLPYLQNQPNMESLPKALNELMQALDSGIKQAEQAIEDNQIKDIIACTNELVKIADTVNSDALNYLMSNIQTDCENGMVDNVSIRWPATKQGIQKTLRVVYSHLQE